MIEKQKEDHTVAGPQHKSGTGITDDCFWDKLPFYS